MPKHLSGIFIKNLGQSSKIWACPQQSGLMNPRIAPESLFGTEIIASAKTPCFRHFYELEGDVCCKVCTAALSAGSLFTTMISKESRLSLK